MNNTSKATIMPGAIPAASTTTRSQRTSFSALALFIVALIVFPLIAPTYWVYFLAILGINIVACHGLNITMGYTGLLSLGHAAFMGVGAYTAALSQIHFSIPFWLGIPLAGAVAAVVGIAFGLPSLRIRGLYVVIATLAAQFLLMFVFVHWQSVTNGDVGLNIAPAEIFGFQLNTDVRAYYLILFAVIASTLFAANVIKSRVGRAFIAVRERDLTAEVLGVRLVQYKLLAFALGSFYAGVAGGLMVYFNKYLTPEQFSLTVSVFFLSAIIVGGQGTILGGILGAVFMTLVPEVLRLSLLFVGDSFGVNTASILVPLRETIFGVLIVGFLIFEPRGLAHIWRKMHAAYSTRRTTG